MVFHAGIDSINGELLLFDSENEKTNKYEITKLTRDGVENVDSFFEEIKFIAGENLGHACVLISDQTAQKMRRKLVSAGKNIGFQEIGLLTYYPALYLQAVVEARYIPKDGDIICVNVYNLCDIWEIQNGKAVHNVLQNIPINSDETFNNFMIRCNYSKLPNVLLYSRNTEYSKTFVKTALECQRFGFHFDKNKFRNSCLIKARAMSKDPEVVKCDFTNVLYHGYVVKYNQTNIMTLFGNIILPNSYIKKINGEHGENTIQVLCDDVVVEVIQLTYVDDYYVVFTIDENQLYSIKIIYSVIGKWIKNNIEIPGNSNAVIPDNAKEHFTIPQKTNIKNVEINGTGIDLGTSRCCAAVNRKNKIETVALDNQGQRLLPSYVGFDESKIKCGQLVVDRLRYFSKYTVFDSKRIIGRMFEDIKLNSGWPFKIINTGNGVCIEVETATETSRKNPEQIATALLKQIKQKAEAFQGQKLRNVVITVPATFTESQKCATHSAAILAGWDIVELLPEPVAAVFAYFIDRPIPNNSTFLLFDLGGGTLDVCVFHIANNEIEILSIDGDSQLGGRDFDNVLIDYFLDRLKTEKGINELGDRKYKLIQDCEKIKEDLSAIDKSWLDIDGYDPSKTGLLTITRTEFEKLSEALLIRIKNCILSALNKSSAKDIDKVFFVGGGSRMPMVKDLLLKIFPGAEHCCEEHPDEVVAVGAAYYAQHIFSNANHQNSMRNKSPSTNLPPILNVENPCCFISKKITRTRTAISAIGIDFGNSSCLLAVNRKYGMVIVPLDNTGERSLPSYVSYDEEYVKVGQIVVNRMSPFAKYTIFDIKKILGKRLIDIEIDPAWPFEIMEQNDKLLIKIQGCDKKAKCLTSVEAAASLLKYVKQKAEEFQGTNLTEAVIPISLDFTEDQRDALLEATRLAGWEKIQLIPEPIAVLLAYFVNKEISKNGTKIIFYLSGTTLDIIIFKIQDNQIQLIANTKDTKLGSKDFEIILFNYLQSLLIANYGIDLNTNKKHRLMSECQKIKHSLSFGENGFLDIGDIDLTNEEFIEISSSQFETLSQNLLNRIRTTINSALYISGYTSDQINEVLQIGGGTRTPMIKKLIQEIFPNLQFDAEKYPEEVIAIGAAYYRLCSID